MNYISDVKKKVLLVQGKPENDIALSEIIHASFDLVHINSQGEAIDFLQKNHDKLISAIIDINLAVPILKEIRKNPNLLNFPVLVSTEVPNSELEEELLSLDVIDFLKTPFSRLRVLNRLKTTVKLSESNYAIDELERDELTGLYTRKAFLRKAEFVLSQNQDKKFCVVAFDFDNFKSSNSLYGVEKCNEFLAYTAQCMMDVMPLGIAGRYGGDQYIMFFEYNQPQPDLKRVSELSKEILNSAPIPHQIVKMGVYAPIDTNIPFVICCDRAFLAIREIKGKYGKNLAFFESNLQKQLLNEQRITETMERALEENQFQVFYQPKHDAITGSIAGAEALVRWNHPEYGFMSPGQFIPLFERNGFITKLDTFMLESVCLDISRWQQSGYPVVPVSVNVSRRDFMEEGCIEKQYEIIDKYGIDHSLLHMEVTESLYSENTELIISQVKNTQNLGFMIEMDDFGAGYSSLGLLSTFPLNVLKLDISFVRNIKKNEVVIENIIKMAHRMGLITVAEGVETDEQLKILKSLGCDLIQGYYYSKPLPVKDFESYIRTASIFSGGKIPLSKSDNDEPISLTESMLIVATEVAESIPGGYFSYHADGNLEIISFNREMLNLFDCNTAEEFREHVGNSFKGIVAPEDFEHVQQSINRQITINNDLDYVEYRIRTKAGKTKYVKDYGRFVKTKSYGDIFYVFLNDVTDEVRRNAEAEVELLRKIELQRVADYAENANHAKNVFMSNITRDILSKMQDIIEYTNLIRSNPGDTSLISDYVLKAVIAEEHLLSFINNVYELSEIENGTLSLYEEPSDMSDAVEKIYSAIKESAEEKNLKVEYWAEIINPFVYQDVMHTTNVVFNIVRNAIKYTMPGGKIRFGLRQIPGKTKDECIVEFICADSGIGISKEFIPYVCKSFTREDNEINANISSAGLGMSIAKSLMKLMHGTIEITSEKGKGTVVKTSQPHRYASKEDINKNTLLTDNVRL